MKNPNCSLFSVRLSTFSLGIAAFALCALPVLATTRYVVTPGTTGVNPTSPYTSWETAATNIQTAVNLAISGDEVLVKTGIYYLSSTLTISKAITLRSDNGLGEIDRAATILDGGYPAVSNRCVFINGAAATIDGFTITNGYASLSSETGVGGGVYAKTYGTIIRCTIAGNRAEGIHAGAGVRLNGTACQIRDSLIAGNVALQRGGGICIVGGTASNCIVRQNRATVYGGGVYIVGGVTPASNQLLDSVVEENTVYCSTEGYGGAGVWSQNAALISGCDIVSNTLVTVVTGNKPWSGGVTIGAGGILRNSLIAWNTGAYYAGGIEVATDAMVSNCVVQNNQGSRGAGIWCKGKGVFDSIIVNNNGIGIFCNNTSVGSETVRNCLIADNDDKGALCNGYATSFQNCTIANNGSGISFETVTIVTNTVENSIVYSNAGTQYTLNANVCATWTNSCTTPLPSGPCDVGNIDVSPKFIDAVTGNYRLLGGQCVNTGVNRDWMVGAFDLDGNARIRDGVGGTVDMGCYECNPIGTVMSVR